jgi:drug/metabolite transporter (DMT)-like permease
MGLGVFCASSTSALVKFLGAQVSGPDLMVWRSIFILPILFLLWKNKTTTGFRSNQPWLQILRSVLGMGALLGTIVSLRSLELAEFTFLFFTSPLMGSLISMIFLREKPRIETLASLLLGFMGVYITLSPSIAYKDTALIGYGAALLGALCYAGSTLVGKKTANCDDPLVYLFYYTVICLGYGVLFRDYSQQLPDHLPWLVIIVLVAMALLNIGSNLLFNLALQRESVQRLFPLKFLDLPFAVGWGFILWRNFPQVSTLIGGSLIFVAVGILAQGPRMKKLKAF